MHRDQSVQVGVALGLLAFPLVLVGHVPEGVLDLEVDPVVGDVLSLKPILCVKKDSVVVDTG